MKPTCLKSSPLLSSPSPQPLHEPNNEGASTSPNSATMMMIVLERRITRLTHVGNKRLLCCLTPPDHSLRQLRRGLHLPDPVPRPNRSRPCGTYIKIGSRDNTRSRFCTILELPGRIKQPQGGKNMTNKDVGTNNNSSGGGSCHRS